MLNAGLYYNEHTHTYTQVCARRGSSNFVPQDLLLPWCCTASPYIAMETQKMMTGMGLEVKWVKSIWVMSSQTRFISAGQNHIKHLSGLQTPTPADGSTNTVQFRVHENETKNWSRILQTELSHFKWHTNTEYTWNTSVLYDTITIWILYSLKIWSK